MTTQCEWCESQNIKMTKNTVYWELPDGSRAIEITETPACSCENCGMFYQPEKIVQSIEEQLLLINTKKLDKTISYDQLMKMERWLKRNYFDF